MTNEKVQQLKDMLYNERIVDLTKYDIDDLYLALGELQHARHVIRALRSNPSLVTLAEVERAEGND